MTEGEEDPTLLPNVLGNGIGALLGLAVAGSPGAVLGAAVSPAVAAFVRRGINLWRYRSEVVQAVAADVAKIDVARLRERVGDDPQLLALVARVIRAAEVTGRDHVLRALGAVLGQAVGDPTRVDEAALLVDALGDMRELHVTVLDVVGEPGPRAAAATDDPPQVHWNPGELVTRLHLTEGVVLAVTATLVRHGLVRTLGTFGGGIAYELTEEGRLLLATLHAVQ